MDCITLSGLRFSARHGVLDFEKTEEQPFTVDVTLFLPLDKPAESDRVEDTINYGAVADAVEEIVLGPTVNLIERLCALICDRLWKQFPELSGLRVTVGKPEAPLNKDFKTASVTMTRGEC